jgi:hypothetical protein
MVVFIFLIHQFASRDSFTVCEFGSFIRDGRDGRVSEVAVVAVVSSVPVVSVPHTGKKKE